MVEGMSVVVNVILSLMSVMSPPPALCNLSARTVVKLCTLGVCFRGELGLLNCDDICMCVVNKQFELLEFIFDSVYVDLQYDEIFLTFTAVSVVVFGLFVRLLWYPLCGCGGCCACDACMLTEYEGARLAAMLV